MRTRPRSPSRTGRVYSKKHAGVPGPHVEVGHFGYLRQVGAGIASGHSRRRTELACKATESAFMPHHKNSFRPRKYFQIASPND
jgi:hypothetical protein